MDKELADDMGLPYDAIVAPDFTSFSLYNEDSALLYLRVKSYFRSISPRALQLIPLDTSEGASPQIIEKSA